MRKPLPKAATIAILGVAFFFAGIECKADSITLAVAPSLGTGTSSKGFNVPSNVVAQIVSAWCLSSAPSGYGYGITSWVTVDVAGTPAARGAYYPGSPYGTVTNLPSVSGPATITLWATNWGAVNTPLSFCTIQTTSSTGFTPSTAVVIPSDGGGPVTIILESSVDLVNWTAAMPGTYGTTTSNRFFRVRAQR